MLNEKDIKKQLQPKPRAIDVKWLPSKKYKLTTIIKSDGTTLFDIETDISGPSMDNTPRKSFHG